MSAIIQFDLDVSEMTSRLLYSCRRGVQKEIKIQIHQQTKEIGIPLYALISTQNEPNPFTYHSAVLDHRKLVACFLSNLFHSQFSIVKI